MYPLFPFSQNTSKITLSGSVERQDEHSLKVTFLISDPRGALIYGPQGEHIKYDEERLVRKHELWKHTCFELFISSKGSESYYECNVNTKGEWNMYHFDSYRMPQPPTETEAYRVVSIECKEGEITAVIRSRDELPSVLDCALTAVIVTTHGESFYALAHKGEKPDFHIRESFVMEV